MLVIQPPGWGCGAALYEQSLEFLSEYFTLFTYDPRGSGGSDTGTLPVNIAQFSTDLFFLFRELGLPAFHLLGHSHGGWIAMHFAIRYPEAVKKLVLVSPEMEHTEEFGIAQMTYLESRRHEPKCQLAVQVMLDTVESHFENLKTDAEFFLWFYTVLPLYAHFPDRVQDLFMNMDLPRFCLSTLRATRTSNPNFPISGQISSIRLSTLILVGRSDFLGLRLVSDRLKKVIPDAFRFEISHAGHFPWLEQPEIFQDSILEFLGLDESEQI